MSHCQDSEASGHLLCIKFWICGMPARWPLLNMLVFGIVCVITQVSAFWTALEGCLFQQPPRCMFKDSPLGIHPLCKLPSLLFEILCPFNLRLRNERFSEVCSGRRSLLQRCSNMILPFISSPPPSPTLSHKHAHTHTLSLSLSCSFERWGTLNEYIGTLFSTRNWY